MAPTGSTPTPIPAPGLAPGAPGASGTSERDRIGHTSTRITLDGSQMARFLHALASEEHPPTEANALPIVPGYRILHMMKESGEGRVHLGVDEKSGRRVAVKVLAARTGIASAFWRHIEVLRQLDLPCVARLLDWGTLGTDTPEGQRFYLVFEFIDGSPITEYCRQRARERSVTDSRRDFAALLAAVADAVHAVHERAVLHRDLKPGNILITPDGRPMLIDFGIAITIGDDPSITLTVPGTPIGSPAFMPPEQAAGDRARVSTRSDVYALGATAYAVLTGTTPHETHGTAMDVLARVGSQPAREVRAIDPAFPRALAAVLEQAVAREPEQRYESAAAFSADLRRWLAGEPVLARGGDLGLVGWAARTIRRHPVLVTAGACALMLASTLGGVVLGHGWMRRPAGINLDAARQRLTLYSSVGKLYEWDSGAANGIRAAAFLPASAAGDDAGLVVFSQGTPSTLLNSDSSVLDRLGFLCAYAADDPERLVWKVGPRAEPWPWPTRKEAESPEGFLCDDAIVADVFPEFVGSEIAAIHNHSSNSLSCIAIYTRSGETLYQAWHDGRLNALCWMRESRRLLASGVNSDSPPHAEGQPRRSEPPYPHVVFAIEPVFEPQETRDHRCMFVRPRDGERPARIPWYKQLTPKSVTDRLADSILETFERPVQGRGFVRLGLRFSASEQVGYMLLDDQGNLLNPDGVVVDAKLNLSRLTADQVRRMTLEPMP